MIQTLDDLKLDLFEDACFTGLYASKDKLDMFSVKVLQKFF